MCSVSETNGGNELMEAEKNTRKCAEEKGGSFGKLERPTELFIKTCNFLTAIRGEAEAMCAPLVWFRLQWTMTNDENFFMQ